MVAAHGYWRSLSEVKNVFHCVSVFAVSTWSPPETSSSEFGFAASATFRVSSQPAPSFARLPDEPICGSPKNRKSKSPVKDWVLNVYVDDQAPVAPTGWECGFFSGGPSMTACPLTPPLTVFAATVAG